MADIKTPAKGPERCICGRIPTITKGKSCGWTVTCPDPTTCKHTPTSGRWPDLARAVKEWNTTIEELRRKEAKK